MFGPPLALFMANVIPALAGFYASDVVLRPANAAAGFRFQPNGAIDIEQHTWSNGASHWLSPLASGAGAGYWIRATLAAGGDVPAGDATGAWLSLSTTRTWTLATTSSNTVKTCSLTIDISTAAGGSPIVATGTYTIDAESSS